MKAKKKRLLSNSEIAAFCNQTAMILSSGILPAEGMGIMMEDAKNAQGKELLAQIQESCYQGNSFHDALAETEVFPDYVLHMIQLGEESGNYDNVLQALANYYEKQDAISETMRNAISYPLIMLAMMVLVIFVLITRVLPIFNQVYSQLGSEMNGISKSLLNLGNSMNRYSIVFIVLLGLFIIGYIFFNKSQTGKEKLTAFLNNFPLTKGFYESVAASRFASGLSLTMAAGMDTYTSLDLVAKLVENPQMEKKIMICKDSLTQGDNLSEALANSNIFNSLYSRMVSVGFRSGSIDTVMETIAERYEHEIEQKIYRIISILEPTLVIILSLVVGMILLSVILPLMGIMSTIG